jgi:hypothetical protein
MCIMLGNMAYIHENSDLDGEAYQFGPEELVPPIEDMPERAVFYAFTDAIITDFTGRIYIDPMSPALTQDRAPELIDGGIELSRVIRVDNGYIVDESHLNITDFESRNKRFSKMMTQPGGYMSPEEVERVPDYLPVIAWAGNTAELELIEEILAGKYNLVLTEENLLRAYVPDDEPGDDTDEVSLPN